MAQNYFYNKTMIYVITGKTGHGKTAYCAKWAREALRFGDRVYSNTKLFPENMFSKRKYKKLFGENSIEGDITKQADRDNEKIKILYWNNFSDWAFMKEGTVICDEGIVYFNARKWEALPDTMQMKFVQHRKDKLDLVLNVQHYTFIDKTLRMLCERFINCELKLGSAAFKKTILPRISRITDIDLPTLNRCENLGIDPYNATREEAQKYNLQTIGQSWFWIRQKIFTWYNTSIKVLPSRPEKLIHMERSCPDCGKIAITHG